MDQKSGSNCRGLNCRCTEITSVKVHFNAVAEIKFAII